jgi:hypothetical protein
MIVIDKHRLAMTFLRRCRIFGGDFWDMLSPVEPFVHRVSSSFNLKLMQLLPCLILSVVEADRGEQKGK